MLLTIVTSTALLLAVSDPAHAGFLIAPVVALIGLTGAAATVATAVIGVALSVGLSYVASKLLAKTPEIPDVSSLKSVGGIQLDLRVDPDIPQSLIVGRAVTAGSLAYANTFGTRGDIDNSDLVEVIALADHPCEKLHSAFVEGVECVLRDSGTDRGLLVDGYTGPVDKVTLDEIKASFGQSLFGNIAGPLLYNQLDAQGNLKKYGDLLALRFFDGRQTTADSFTVDKLGTAQRPWTASHVGTGITYVRTHSIYERERVPGRLNWKFVVDGIRLYDPRKDSTVAGGSGPHRFSDLSTHEWTDNLATIAYNVCRGIYVADVNGNRKFFYGIEGTAADQLPLDVWFAVMNEADVLVERGDGDFERQFCGGAEISLDTEPREMIQGLLRASGGRFVEIGGIYKLYFGAPGLPVLNITDDVIVASREEQYRPVLGLEQRVNYLTGTYTSPADGWITKVAPPRENITWRAEDGRRLPADLTAPMVQSDTQMQRIMLQLLNRARRQRKHVLTLPPPAMVLEPGDVFAWDSARNGYVDKLFEIDNVDYEPNLNVTVSCTEVDPDDYGWSSDDELPVVGGRLVTLLPAAKVITGFSAEGYVWRGDLGQVRPAVKLIWGAPDDNDINGVRWQIRLSADPTDNISGLTDRDDVVAGQIVIAAGLQSLTQYQVRARFESWNGYITEWSLWIPVTTPAVYIEQVDLSAIVNRTLESVAPAIRDANDVAESVALIAARVMQDADDNAILIERNRQDLHVKANGISAAVVTETQARIDGDAAEASARLLVKADVDANMAAIAAEAVARADGDSAVAATVTVLAATVDDNTAAISSEATARADADSAIVSTATTLATKVDDISASYTFRASVSSNVPLGALSAVDLQVRADSGASWGEAGLQLAVYSYSGVLYSRARIYADLTEIGSTASGGFVPVFSVQVVNGVSKIALNGDALPDDVISSRSLVAGADEAQIIAKGSADIAKTYAAWNNSGAGDVIMSATFPTLDGEALDIDFECILENAAEGNTQLTGPATLKLTMNDVQIDTVRSVYQSGGTTSYYMTYTNFATGLRRLATGCMAGDTTIKAILILPVADGARTLHVKNPQMLIRRIKRPLLLDGSNTVGTATKSYRASYYTGSTASKTGADIGTANANRLVVVAVGWQSANSNTPSLTVGGLAAQLIATSTKNNTRMALFAVPKSTGTTADIVASLPSGATEINFVVWAVVAGSTAPVHYGFAFWGGPATGDVATGAINIQDKSVLVAAVYGGSGASNYAATWSGGDTITERADAVPSGSGIRHAEYDLSGTENVAGRALTITQTQSGAPPYDDFVWVAGVWR